jgi:shikimate kinase / 3-dehydroquinate synthase
VRANVYLCGPPGAGKSTVAPLLAALRGADAFDVDVAVEAEDGRPIARIVDEDGEPAFRARERAAIAAFARRGGAVVALGAGALEDAENRRALAESGVTVFLDASVETCEARTAHEAGKRPLLRAPGALSKLHAARRPRYLGADVTIAVDGIAPEAVARAVDAALAAIGEDAPSNRHDGEQTQPERIVRFETAKPYDVAIGPRALDALPLRARPQQGGRVAVVVDERVAVLGEQIARDYEAAGFAAAVIPVRADESLKSLDAVGALYAAFAGARVDRRGLIVGVGGGTIGDAVGFAAATSQRGVPFAAVPTTLLAAVDAALGGKTAINLPSGKNLVGTVTQPAHVAIAPHVLRTLPRRDVVSGYGEMLKYGLALDANLYRALRAGESALLDDPATALDAIARCVELKAEIVARDEEDRTGTRAVLNFGHTVGHALEKVAGYGTLRHGEAVIVGMRAALALSVARGILDQAARADADAHLAALPVPPEWRALDASAVLDATAGDKKRHAGGTQYVLLEKIGRARLDDGVRREDVRDALAELGLR